MPAPDLKETYVVLGDCVQLVFVITITCILLSPPYRFEETLSLVFLQEELATTLHNISLVGYSRIQFLIAFFFTLEFTTRNSDC